VASGIPSLHFPRAPAGRATLWATKGDAVLRNPDHVTIAVAHAAPAIEFFALLGFRKDHVAVIDGGEPAAYMGMPDMKSQHITLVLDGAEPHFEIQLLEFDPTPGSDADPGEHPTNLRRLGYNHLAFRVDDIAATSAHLIENGVRMLNEEMDYISRKLRFFEGPEGITLELVQWVDDDEANRQT
jgi:catechol 2,3-dioxygenase-like lactoylglutathione lyase family enzyme